jgi:hypothetical protein
MIKVKEAHTHNQDQLDKLHKEVEQCGSTKTDSVGIADLKKAVYEKTSPLHKTCRAGEAGKHSETIECFKEQKDKRRIMDLKCKEFKLVGQRYGDQQANGQIVKSAGSEGEETYVRRITSTFCGKPVTKGKLGAKLVGFGGAGKDGFLDLFLKAKQGCDDAKKEYKGQATQCKALDKEYSEQKESCDSLQDQMDGAACKRAVDMKDACEAYSECFFEKSKVFDSTEHMVQAEEKDRKAEWKGLARMKCLMKGFENGKMSNREVKACRDEDHDLDHLTIRYPIKSPLEACVIPDLYPATAAYKLAEFAGLPSLAKGKDDANTCSGVVPVPTKPMQPSPPNCTCERVTLNGPYSPGPLVKCTGCRDIRRSQDHSSCPEGTKLFAPRSADDWKTVFGSAEVPQDPHFIVDVTSTQNGGRRSKYPMNSEVRQQKRWKTSDGSAWWLRSTPDSEPSGDYHANCFLRLKKPKGGPFDENNLKFNDANCNYHSKSYFCQLKEQIVKPKQGSPAACKCDNVVLAGPYSAGSLLKCTGCLPVARSLQKNSCPTGTKIFSPASATDWKTFLSSAQPLRSPHWIIDVTRSENGCGGCAKHAMNSKNPAQMTWRTSDGSAWWLRSQKYTEPSSDYSANCYMDLFGAPSSENSVLFRPKNCRYYSNAYYCQPVKKKEEEEEVPEPQMEPPAVLTGVPQKIEMKEDAEEPKQKTEDKDENDEKDKEEKEEDE